MSDNNIVPQQTDQGQVASPMDADGFYMSNGPVWICKFRGRDYSFTRPLSGELLTLDPIDPQDYVNEHPVRIFKSNGKYYASTVSHDGKVICYPFELSELIL